MGAGLHGVSLKGGSVSRFARRRYFPLSLTGVPTRHCMFAFPDLPVWEGGGSKCRFLTRCFFSRVLFPIDGALLCVVLSYCIALEIAGDLRR